MSGKATILLRRMGVKSETVKKGLFSHEPHLVLDGECGDDEVLCFVTNDGKDVRQVDSSEVGELSADGKTLKVGGMLFAVRRTPFHFGATVKAGTDAESYEWSFEAYGDAEILDPCVFATKFRGAVTDDEPLFVETFGLRLGTILSTALHDKVITEALGVASLQDKDAGGRYVDMQYRLEQSKEVGEKVVSSAFDKTFTQFFEASGIMSMSVTHFRAFSADREAELSATDAADALVRQTATEIAALQRDIDLARLNNEKARIEADTEALKAKSKAFLGNVEALDRLMNMNFTASNAPNLEKLLALAGREDAVGRIMDAVDSAIRGDPRVTMDLEPRTRAIGPRLRVMRQGGLYGLSIDIPRDGHLVLLDVCDDNKVIPVVPCSDSQTKSTFVKNGQTVVIGSRSNPWITDPFEQYEGSGMDRFVAFITDEPLLKADESVRFGQALPSAALTMIVDRLEGMKAGELCGGLLQVRISR